MTDMLIGIIGAPNKGKSLIFSTLTSIVVAVADYPFTTIEPNRGVALLRVPCAHVAVGLAKCDARGGHCKNGMREIAVPLLDVAGLVPGASEGRGMGNQFLDDLRTADGFIQVVDASGRTDLEGNPAQDFELEKEINFLGSELEAWLWQVVERNAPKFRFRGLAELAAALSGLGYDQPALAHAAQAAGLRLERIEWSGEELKQFTHALYHSGKPMIVAANKADIAGALERVEKTRADLPSTTIRACSAIYEQVLQKAAKSGMIRYEAGAAGFEVIGTPDTAQEAALERIRSFMKENGGTGVHALLHQLVFKQLGMQVVYPVEDENHYCDRSGVVLPDALLVPPHTTTLQLAEHIHTDLAKSFICAVDARTKRRLGKDHLVENGDIVKIVAAR